MAEQRTIEYRKVTDLHPHPDQARVYGDADDGLANSFLQLGRVITPLIVTKGNVVISGHRRLAAAKKASLAEVPVEVFHSEDESDVREALIHANKTRTRTRRQVAAEAAVLLEVETERAGRRRLEGQKAGGKARHGSSPEPVPGSSDRGEAADRVGAAMTPPLSGKTVRQAAEVDAAINDLERQGKSGEAERLTKVLNEKGFKAAHDAVRKGPRRKKAAPVLFGPDYTRAASTLFLQLKACLRHWVKNRGRKPGRAWCEARGLDFQVMTAVRPKKVQPAGPGPQAGE